MDAHRNILALGSVHVSGASSILNCQCHTTILEDIWGNHVCVSVCVSMLVGAQRTIFPGVNWEARC